MTAALGRRPAWNDPGSLAAALADELSEDARRVEIEDRERDRA